MPDPCVNLRELELPKPSDAVSRHSLGLDPAVDGVTRNPKMRRELFDRRPRLHWTAFGTGLTSHYVL